MYIPTPIYLRKNYFSYYLDINHELKFDIEDLFYYSSHKIMKRQGHLFVNDYGMQVTILGRFGIKPHAVCGKDYIFENGDSTDMRYSNIKIINPYHGVSLIHTKSGNLFRVKLHINGNYTIGEYKTVNEAAIAYNKAADLAKDHGIERSFFENYIEDLSPKEYARIYTELDISPKFLQYLKNSDSGNDKYDSLSDRVKYYKETEEGVQEMCKAMEDMRNEAQLYKTREIALNLIVLGELSFEKIAKVTNLSIEEVKNLAESKSA